LREDAQKLEEKTTLEGMI
jgi:hypothetical protein